MKNVKNYYPLLTAFLLALLAHSVVIYRFLHDGTMFTGKGDGIAQMIPFQLFLYDQFSHLNFFYSMGFGIGGDFFRSLAYYYSTSPVYYLNFILVYIGHFIFPYDTSSPVFWAGNQIFISVIKLTAIIWVMYRLLRYFNINRWSSMTASFLYGYSTVYFFFTFTWSFFSDVMIWLPLTIWGMERFFAERKIGLFIIAIALTLHANFYFSYYEFIFVLFYFVYRTIYTKPTDIVSRPTKITVISIAAILALMSSAVGFYTGVTSYLMNDRTLPPLKIKPLIDFIIHYNLFYDGYYIVLPFLIVMALMTFRLYQHYTFRLYSVMTFIFFAGSLSPLFDSFFNGFSIDQRRWVYLLAFVSSVVIAIYLDRLSQLTIKELMISIVPLVIILGLSIFSTGKWLYWLIFVPIIIGMIIAVISRKEMFQAVHVVIIVMNLFFVYDYITQQMDTLHPKYEHDLAFLTSEKYNSTVQQQLVNEITKHHPSERIDWQTFSTHNTPMYQHFNGIKLYSSIFDKDIYRFYDKELFVTMDTDSNSIYYRLGERANLYSLFNVNHSIRTNNLSTLPYGFSPVKTAADTGDKTYTVMKNNYPLPVVRVTNQVFDEKKLTTPIDREHAMLEGVVLNQQGNRTVAPVPNLLTTAKASLNHATLSGTQLNVSQDQGGLTLKLNKKDIKKYKDLYIDLNIVLKSPSKYHYVWLNEIYQSRKPLDDDYRRYNPRITMRVKASDVIQLKLMTGSYDVSFNGIYGEDYQTLKKASVPSSNTLEEKGNKIIAHISNHQGGYAVIPTPYLKGMTAKVDGKKAPIMEGNYLMTAVKVDKDAKEIIIKYVPPYFHLMQLVSIIGIILSIFFAKKVYSKQNTH